MKFLYSFLLIGIFVNSYSQDTIAFLNKTIQVAKVREIGFENIQYNRFDNIDGPVYTVSKKNVHYIKYANGDIDSISRMDKKMSVINSGEIEVSGNRLAYKGKAIMENGLYNFISKENDVDKKSKLLVEYAQLKKYKRRQYLYFFGGITTGFILPLFFMNSFVGPDGTVTSTGGAVYAFSNVAIGVTGAIFSAKNKKKRTQKRLEIAKLYNK